jgi:hypothetical protein
VFTAIAYTLFMKEFMAVLQDLFVAGFFGFLTALVCRVRVSGAITARVFPHGLTARPRTFCFDVGFFKQGELPDVYSVITLTLHCDHRSSSSNGLSSHRPGDGPLDVRTPGVRMFFLGRIPEPVQVFCRDRDLFAFFGGEGAGLEYFDPFCH